MSSSLALTNCASLLSSGGILLLTVPDLEIHVARYLQKAYKTDLGYAGWAQQRIPSDAPDSCYFSLFAHSMTYEPHLWCYDQAGLGYKVASTGAFQTQFVLPKDSALAETPFTHNRPDEDLCLIAIR
jgi:hypothetical protein